MKKRLTILTALLLVMLQSAWAESWSGKGTEQKPYLIENTQHWQSLKQQVEAGNAFSGVVFRLTNDIDTQGNMVGNDQDKPFSGTFDGDGHMLTFNVKVDQAGDSRLAPFFCAKGAAFRHISVSGEINASTQYAAGLVSKVFGPETTTIYDCKTTVEIWGNTVTNAAHGGLVGAVVSGGLEMDRCVFSGMINGNNSAGMVGWSNVDITIRNSMVDPSEAIRINGGATFARMAGGAKLNLTDCYTTQVIETSVSNQQGTVVFSRIYVPTGCTYKILDEPFVRFNGVDYWTSGTWVELSAPDDMAFDHWCDPYAKDALYISDPWTKNGRHQLRDIHYTPVIQIATSMPEARTMHTIQGVKYRYLSSRDYKLYLSDELCRQKGWSLDNKEYLVGYDKDGDKLYISAAVGYEGDINKNMEGDWIWNTAFTGTILTNDCVSASRDRTHLAVIAPRAFKGCTDLKKVTFQSDNGSDIYKAVHGPDFIIGEEAFADCPNLTEFVMMYYNRTGTDKWDVMAPTTAIEVADDAFSGSPNCRIMVDPTVYQDYLSSTTWQAQQNRIGIYMKAEEDMSVNGAKYSYMRDSKGNAIKNDAAGHEAMMNTLRYWTADYQDFVGGSLLAQQDKKNIWYAQIVGADTDYLNKNNGVMRIYNDPGSYYNYKTVAIGENAFSGCEALKAIEFWQTNGRSENSLSDMKIVIRNGALKGCKNLRELRLFYYVQDGDDHWEALGPQDVIPGNNIFGVLSEEERIGMTEEENASAEALIPTEDLKILVSTSRYQEFMNDLNWEPYLKYIEPVEFDPTNSRKDFTLGDQKGITYGYVTNPGGILVSSQTVSQDVSWWTAPRIAIELALDILSMGSASGSAAELSSYGAFTASEYMAIKKAIANEWGYKRKVIDFLKQVFPYLYKLPFKSDRLKYTAERLLPKLIQEGIVNQKGKWLIKTEAEMVAKLSGSMAANDLGVSVKVFVNNYIQHLAETGTKSLAKKALIYSLGGAACASTTTASYLAAKQWGGTGAYNGDQLLKGMRANILSNMHQAGLVGGAYVITTPVKNIAYHTYIKEVKDDVTHAVIYAGTDKGQGHNANTVTTTFAKKAFRDKKNLQKVSFYENNVSTNEAVPMLLTIPDSAFVGCDNLTELNLLLDTKSNGQQPLGPEAFILGGDSIFAGLSPEKFHIVIDPSRKQDFLANESWKPLEKYFVYKPAKEKVAYDEYGGQYAYVYERGTVQKVSKSQGHKIEHMKVIGATTDESEYLLSKHQGALKLCNDIGVYNNFQLDAVRKNAFKGNQDLRVVYFTDLKGTGAYGDSYTGFEMTLEDSCFADTKNLADIDMLYLVTDGDNHIDLITPQQLKLGKGVFDGSTARIKMMPQQVAWFEADTTWNKYRDRFMPCVVKVGDEGIKKALKQMAYKDMAATGYDTELWTDYIDFARIAGAGFSWLDGKFTDQKDNILSFADFKHFESVGLDYVGKEWFKDCAKLSNILLPSTIKRIGASAFQYCSSLEEIEIPAGVEEIESMALAGCNKLNHIVVRGETPAKIGSLAFEHNSLLKIYVPTAKVNAYKQAWPAYADYIVGMDQYDTKKTIELTQAGTLAEKLGLSIEWSYTGVIAGDEPRYLHGNYSKYDSLTISGPLNNVDLAVIRYLAGSDSYNNNGGNPTDGKLRYLNLLNARIKKDDNDKAHYANLGGTFSSAWADIKEDDVLPDYLFSHCGALQTAILPQTVKKYGTGIFFQCSALKRVAMTGSIEQYEKAGYMNGMISYPLEELSMMTDTPAKSECGDAWMQPVENVYVKKSQMGDYISQPYLTVQAQSLLAPFADDAVIDAMTKKGHFFPGEYLEWNNVENLFNDNKQITSFNDFRLFTNVKELHETFRGASNLRSITLPDSLKSIGPGAFAACESLDTICIQCDSVPQLAQDAFAGLAKDFKILVPKQLCKLYRTKWAQYADHINPDNSYYAMGDTVKVVYTKEMNTLAKELGLTVTYDTRHKGANNGKKITFINSVRGDYSNVRKLKVVGPISGADLSLLRYMAGFCPWANTRNAQGQLEYIDLYDAELKASEYEAAPDMFWQLWHKADESYVRYDNVLPYYAFLQAYSLKTLILPRTLTKVESRAMQECENLETLVIGDDMTDFNWSSLDDCASMTRLYILAKQKPALDMDNWLWRNLCNNYHPTFDAFYVRPSLYQEYLKDDAYAGMTWQRTNNISKGAFDDDESFTAFAAHAAATSDDLAQVNSVEGWFDKHGNIRDLTPLKYTAIDSLSKVTVAPLTQMEAIALPKSLAAVEEGTFAAANNLRYVDMLLCDSTVMIDRMKNGGLKRMGINTDQTLVYVPQQYGETDEVNVIWGKVGSLQANTYRLVDGLDYNVPYTFQTQHVRNSRKIAKSDKPYTLCLPYQMSVAGGARLYALIDRSGATLTFSETDGQGEAMKPYLLLADQNGIMLDSDQPQTIQASVGVHGEDAYVAGYVMRGTLKAIDNKTAADMGAHILQSDGQWHPVYSQTDDEKKAVIMPYRAYLLPSTHGAGTRMMSIKLINNDGTTAIYSLDADTGDAEGEGWYTTDGRRLPAEPARHGVYIHQGHKVVK